MTREAGGLPAERGAEELPLPRKPSRKRRPTPPDPGPEPLPPWLRYTTHLVALAWGTAELAIWGARPGSFTFISLVLLGSEGSRLAGRVHRALRT